jgi:hypothetical protein
LSAASGRFGINDYLHRMVSPATDRFLRDPGKFRVCQLTSSAT